MVFTSLLSLEALLSTHTLDRNVALQMLQKRFSTHARLRSHWAVLKTLFQLNKLTTMSLQIIFKFKKDRKKYSNLVNLAENSSICLLYFRFLNVLFFLIDFEEICLVKCDFEKYFIGINCLFKPVFPSKVKISVPIFGKHCCFQESESST